MSVFVGHLQIAEIGSFSSEAKYFALKVGFQERTIFQKKLRPGGAKVKIDCEILTFYYKKLIRLLMTANVL